MSHEQLKIGIIGMGPIGMILAVKLKEAGCDVAVCDVDRDKMKKISEEGIVIENLFDSTTRIEKVYTSPAEMSHLGLDFLIFCLKSYHTPSAVKDAEILKSEKLTVVSGQNGIDVEELLFPVFGKGKTLRMIINFAGNQTAANKVKATFFTPPNYVGSVDDNRSTEAELFARTLNNVGFFTEKVGSAEIRKSAWEKTILNASLSALCGVTRLTMKEAMADAGTGEITGNIIRESIEVAEKENIRFAEGFVQKCLGYLKKAGDHFPSLAVDLMNNRQTEIDFLNKKFVDYGIKNQVKTPLNAAFTNMVKAMSGKTAKSKQPVSEANPQKKIVHEGLIDKTRKADYYLQNNFFLGLDIGSAFSKITVIDENQNPVFRYILPSFNIEKDTLKKVVGCIHEEINIRNSCHTGYGRKYFSETTMQKTEINCAAVGVSKFFPGEKNIIDIGGEDIKITHCSGDDLISNFYMNDKCAAGTGAFINEIADRAGIDLEKMSALAATSGFNRELNSFCTVFAKTEIMNWVFDGMPVNDIARGIYISIANRVTKMRIAAGIPSYMIGGVIAYHPYLATILADQYRFNIKTLEHPQFVVSYGAALLALKARTENSGNEKNRREIKI